MSYPRTTNHLTRWIFTIEQIANIRQTAHDEALLRLNNRKWKKKVKVLSMEEQCTVVDYMTEQLLLLCKNRAIRPIVMETAVIFFKRFYLRRSMMEYDPRYIIFACISLAIKAEEFSRRYCVADLFGDMEELAVADVMNLELPLCDALEFDLLVLHTREPLLALKEIFVSTLEKKVGGAPNSKKEVQDLVTKGVFSSAELLIFNLLQSDVVLTHTPSQIATTAFLHFARSDLKNVVDAESVIRDTFGSEGEKAIKISRQLENVMIQYLQNKKTLDHQQHALKIGNILKRAKFIWTTATDETTDSGSAQNCSEGKKL